LARQNALVGKERTASNQMMSPRRGPAIALEGSLKESEKESKAIDLRQKKEGPTLLRNYLYRAWGKNTQKIKLAVRGKSVSRADLINVWL